MNATRKLPWLLVLLVTLALALVAAGCGGDDDEGTPGGGESEAADTSTAEAEPIKVGLVTDIGDRKTFVGTAGYFPPEGPGTPSADLYSLGKVLYELATGLELGRFPELPTSFNENEPVRELSAFNSVILKACDVNPRRRYQSAKEMLLDLERVSQRKPGWFGRIRR